MCLICRACLLGLRQIAHLETKKKYKKENKNDACRRLPRRPPASPAARPLCSAGDLTIAMPATCPAAPRR
jgi:hypothetical protein